MWEELCEDLLKETDVAYEEEIGRNPYSIKIWVAYLTSLKKAPANIRYLNYERALKCIPGCYKLWNQYLAERRNALKNVCVTDPAYGACNSLHERALVYCGRMPRLWLDYLELLMKEKKITTTRRTIDAALKALPITQHHRIWDLAIQWLAKETQGGAGEAFIPEETALCLFRRYLMLQPDHVETYIAYLLSRKRYDESAIRMTEIVNDDDFVSIEGKTSHQLWMDLCDVISRHPSEIKSVKIEPIIRNGLMKFTDEVGRLWNALADHYVRLGFFEKARDIYEEAIDKVQTVHDFSIIWEAYTKFMESWLTAMIDKQHKNLELLLARNEQLMERRPEILSSVLLRQNPHNVHQWIERTKLPVYAQKPEKVIETFTEAVRTVDPQKAVGKLNVLYTQFAAFYEKYGDFDNARVIFKRGSEVNFRSVDDLASVWCEWVEFELRHQQYDKALAAARQAVNLNDAEKGSVQSRLGRSVKLWALVADLEESFGTHESTKSTYDRMFELKVITPQIIINYAHYLESSRWYEESFKAFERGIRLFKRPHINDLWIFYLTKFVERYGGRKLERARDLFEEAVVGTEGDVAVTIYCLYARLEEEHGLARHALSIYDRLAKACGAVFIYDVFCVLISKTQEFFGATKAREVYERAIEALPEGPNLIKMCMKYASMEAALGEVDRARAIFQHCSQFCDPNKEKDFWPKWRVFEVQHGNEDTFRDMLRIKRSVDAQYAQVHFNTENITQAKIAREQMDPMAQAEQEMAQKSNAPGNDDSLEIDALLERLGTNAKEAKASFEPSATFQGRRLGFVFKMGVQGVGYYEDNNRPTSMGEPPRKKRALVSNPEEIDIGLDLEEIDIPSAVFGGLAETAASAAQPR
eukprot:GEMP01009569.1.p1 GENE.GEMP01009569.1~~GEMP01009569.1.p1  ORF type:complete len:869 (+),score=177.26 GEMP01009569.1:122-2728(+)